MIVIRGVALAVGVAGTAGTMPGRVWPSAAPTDAILMRMTSQRPPASPPRGDEAAGWEIAEAVCRHARRVFGHRLVAVYAIGSLAHGGFAPASSDVDVAILVDRCDATVAPLVGSIVDHTRAECGPGLADRLSIFYGDWPSFGAPPDTARMGAVDRLDLMEHGMLMHGVDLRASAGNRPSRDELVAESAASLEASLSQRHGIEELLRAEPRVLAKEVLFPVRFLYTQATGRAGANQDAVSWYRDQGGRHAALACAALGWRGGEVDRSSARELLERDLDGLYRECLTAYGLAGRDTQVA